MEIDAATKKTVRAAMRTCLALLEQGASEGLQQEADTLLADLVAELPHYPEPLDAYVAGEADDPARALRVAIRNL